MYYILWFSPWLFSWFSLGNLWIAILSFFVVSYMHCCYVVGYVLLDSICLYCYSTIVLFSSPQGAFTFHGSMIDMPSLKQAQNIVTMASTVQGKWAKPEFLRHQNMHHAGCAVHFTSRAKNDLCICLTSNRDDVLVVCWFQINWLIILSSEIPGALLFSALVCICVCVMPTPCLSGVRVDDWPW